MKKTDALARQREIMEYMEENAVSVDEASFSLLLEHADEFLVQLKFAWDDIAEMSAEERLNTYLNLPYDVRK